MKLISIYLMLSLIIVLSAVMIVAFVLVEENQFIDICHKNGYELYTPNSNYEPNHCYNGYVACVGRSSDNTNVFHCIKN